MCGSTLLLNKRVSSLPSLPAEVEPGWITILTADAHPRRLVFQGIEELWFTKPKLFPRCPFWARNQGVFGRGNGRIDLMICAVSQFIGRSKGQGDPVGQGPTVKTKLLEKTLVAQQLWEIAKTRKLVLLK